jgi:protein-S-isoprenylcysteine O-methyltransferase Ste14
MADKPTGTRDASSAFIWPPTIYAAGALSSALLWWLAPWPYQAHGMRLSCIVAGVVLGCAGLAAAILAERRFHAAGTPVPPTRPTQVLVFDGIYRYTRNPMYLGMTLALLGLGLATNQLWFLIAAPVAVYAVTRLAIEREEAYLTRKFGDPYVAYMKKVRRWL